jgi:hypothetical protein
MKTMMLLAAWAADPEVTPQMALRRFERACPVEEPSSNSRRCLEISPLYGLLLLLGAR